MFRQGVRPVWEDAANINGGKWIVRLKKGLASRYWENLVGTWPCSFVEDDKDGHFSVNKLSY